MYWKIEVRILPLFEMNSGTFDSLLLVVCSQPAADK